MRKCTFQPAHVGYGPPLPPIPGYSITETWVVCKTTTYWTLYHVPTGAFAYFTNTKRRAEWLALALDPLQRPWRLQNALGWARCQWELEEAQSALRRAQKREEKEHAQANVS